MNNKTNIKTALEKEKLHTHLQLLQQIFSQTAVSAYYDCLLEEEGANTGLIERCRDSMDFYLKGITPDHCYSFGEVEDPPAADSITLGEVMIAISRLFERMTSTPPECAFYDIAQECVLTAEAMMLNIFEPLTAQGRV